MYYRECLKYYQNPINKYGVAMMMNGLGEIFIKQNLKDSAKNYFLHALTVGVSINYLPAIIKASQALTSLYSNDGKFEKAFSYQTIYYSSVDSLYREETHREIENIESNTKLAQQDVKIVEANRKHKSEQLLLYLLLSVIGLLIILSLVVIQRFRYKQKTNKILEANNMALAAALNELKLAQIQLVQHEKMASLGQLTAGIAHELNNPINFISANVNPLKRNINELIDELKKWSGAMNKTFNFTIEETNQLLKGIEEGSKRTAEIVKGLRTFSRLDEEKMMRANINEGIESTLLLLQNKLKHQNIEVIKLFGQLPEINCYPGQLNQVFLNLLTNAIDAIGNEGKIFISTEKKKDAIKISIRDTGKGMSDEVKQKIFDPFFTTKEVGKGTGLGLSISYGIVEKHQGKIEVHSDSVKGTEFIVTLPVIQNEN